MLWLLLLLMLMRIDFNPIDCLLRTYSKYKRKKCRSMTSFWQHKLFLDIRKRFLQERRQTGVRSLKSTNLPFHIAISS